MSQLARNLTVEAIGQFVANPLLQVPADLRPAVWNFTSYWSDVLKSDLGLCTRVRCWIDDGVPVADIRAGLQRLTQFRSTATFQFPGQLLAALEEAIIEHQDRAAKKAEVGKVVSRRGSRDPDALSGEELREAMRRHGYGKKQP